MANKTLYTVVPVSRIISIAKKGLMTNDKVAKLRQYEDDIEMRGRLFDESSYGYIYASTDISNALEWSTVIRMQTEGENVLTLEYEVDERDILPDICSPNKNPLDVRIKLDIKPEYIKVLNAEVSVNGRRRVSSDSIGKVPLLDLYDKIEVRCESCKEHTRYKDMVRLSGMLLCKSCADEGRRFAKEIGLEDVPEEIDI